MRAKVPTIAELGSKLPEIARPPHRSKLPGLSEAVKEVVHAERVRDRDRVVFEHLPLVKAIAVRVHENLPVEVDLDDLVHAGILGLFDAVNKFDPDKQVAFTSYAKHRIKGSIFGSLRQLDWGSRGLRPQHKRAEAATRELAAEGSHGDRTYRKARNRGGLGTHGSRARGGVCAGADARHAVMSEAIQTLPAGYQRVVTLYYSNEMTMAEIAETLGIKESRVSEIHKSALEKTAMALRPAANPSA